MISYITELNDNNFKKFTSENGIVLVDIWATWCVPCKTISPMIDEISNEFKNKVKVGKLDADPNPTTITEMKIRNVPTLVVYKNGIEVERHSGVTNKKDISKMLENYLN